MPEFVACTAEEVMRTHLGKIILRLLTFVRKFLYLQELSFFWGGLLKLMVNFLSLPLWIFFFNGTIGFSYLAYLPFVCL